MALLEKNKGWNPSGDEASSSIFWLVFVLSAGIGFWFGVNSATWQAVVEPPQILAGLVEYPRNNPFYVHQTKIWTVLHQLGAICLFCGISEKTLSFVFSGVLGMLVIQAISMIAFVFSRSLWISLLTPFFIIYTGATYFGVGYPILLMGHSDTYGTVALTYSVLVLAVLGSGQIRVGAFLLGFTPAIHPPMGAFLWSVVFVGLMWGIRDLARVRKRMVSPFLLGAAIMAVSLIIHFLVSYDVPVLDRETLTKYLDVFIRYWDAHRQPAPLRSPGATLNYFFLGFCGIWLFLRKESLNEGQCLFLRSAMLLALLGIAAGFLSHLPPENISNIFFELMPTRVLNVVPFCFATILIGAMYGGGQNIFIRVSLLFLLVSGLFSTRIGLFRNVLTTACIAIIVVVVDFLRRRTSSRRDLGVLLTGVALLVLPFITRFVGLDGPYGRKVGIAAGFIFVSYALLKSAGRMEWLDLWKTIDKIGLWASRRTIALGIARRWGIIGILATAMICAVNSENGLVVGYSKAYVLDNYDDDPVLSHATRGQGMLLLSSNLHLFQLRTRRPVLLDGAYLDMLPYTPEVAPEVNRILREVYGVDLFDPPAEVRKGPTGTLPRNTGKELWEKRSIDEWHDIRRKFGVSQVVTYANWSLKLPIRAKSQNLTLYDIP